MLDKVGITNESSWNKISITITSLTIDGNYYETLPYEVNLITGYINRKGKSRILKPMFNTGCNAIPHVNLQTTNKKTIRVNYYELLTYLRIKVGLIKQVEYQYIINKNLDYLDGGIYNLLYLNGLESVYYRDRENFDRYIKNRVCIIDPNYDVYDAIKDGLVVVKPVNIKTNYVGEYFIDTDGVIINNNTGKYIKKYASGLGYLSFTHRVGGIVSSRNVINILGRTFINSNNDTMYSFKDSNIDRANTELINIMPTTRKELTTKYHKNTSDHYQKYLKDSVEKIARKVVINNILFNSFKDAAKYIIKEEKQLGNIRTLPTVASLISIRINNKLKNSNKKIYNRYVVTKVG